MPETDDDGLEPEIVPEGTAVQAGAGGPIVRLYGGAKLYTGSGTQNFAGFPPRPVSGVDRVIQAGPPGAPGDARLAGEAKERIAAVLDPLGQDERDRVIQWMTGTYGRDSR